MACAAFAPAGVAALASERGPERGLLDVLGAEGPNAAFGEKSALFGRFVGVWDGEFFHYDKANVTEHYFGELVFGWIIDGWAMQDMWIGYADAKRNRSVGTSIRFIDPASHLWRVVYIAPEGGVLSLLEGGAVDDRIVLEGRRSDGSLRRWSFNEIQPKSFTWRGEESPDGQFWHTNAEYYFRKRS
jgi:hypothetical protein